MISATGRIFYSEVKRSPIRKGPLGTGHHTKNRCLHELEERNGRAPTEHYTTQSSAVLVLANHLAKSVAFAAQVSLFVASSVHDRIPSYAQKRRSASSHFIHLRLDGRIGRDAPICSVTIVCQSASRQVVPRHIQVFCGLRIVWPAQLHL